MEDVLGDHKEKGKVRKHLQDVLQCSMSRRKPKRYPMLILLPRMTKKVWMQFNVLEMVWMEFFNVTIATHDQNEAIKSKNSRVNKNNYVKKIKAVTTDTESTVFRKLQSLYN